MEELNDYQSSILQRMKQPSDGEKIILENPFENYPEMGYSVRYNNTEKKLSDGMFKEIMWCSGIPSAFFGGLAGCAFFNAIGAVFGVLIGVFVAFLIHAFRLGEEYVTGSETPHISQPIRDMYEELLNLKVYEAEQRIGGIYQYSKLIKLESLDSNEKKRLAKVLRQSRSSEQCSDSEDYRWVFNLVRCAIEEREAKSELDLINAELGHMRTSLEKEGATS